MTRSRTYLGVLLVLFWLSTSAFTTVSQTNPEKRVVFQVSHGDHCVAKVKPIEVGKKSSDIASLTCYDTVKQAAEAATGGTLHLSDNATSQDFDNALRVTPNTSNILIVFYENSNYGGKDLTILTSGSQCIYGVSYGWTSMPVYQYSGPFGTTYNFNWNDKVSSFRPYYNCELVELFSDNNYTGARQCFQGDTSYVGDVMNDRTSSWGSHYTWSC